MYFPQDTSPNSIILSLLPFPCITAGTLGVRWGRGLLPVYVQEKPSAFSLLPNIHLLCNLFLGPYS